MSTSNLQQLGDVIRSAREERGLTVRALGESAKVSASMVTRLETAQLPQPRANHLAALARVLEIDVEDLYAYAGLTAAEALPELPAYLRAKYNLPPTAAARFEELMRELEGGDTSTSPEGTRDGDTN